MQLVDLEASTGEIISFFGGDFFPIRQQLAEKEVKIDGDMDGPGDEIWGLTYGQIRRFPDTIHKKSVIISVTLYFETY